MSDSDSSLELHPIDLEAIDFFNYYDPLMTSPQVSAVLEDDVSKLHSLLKNGRSVNIIDNKGCTPLHVAITQNKRNVFDFLLTLEDTRLNVADYEGVTPLLTAVENKEEYYALELIKKGADVNICGSMGYSCLHLVHNNLTLAQALIDSGADLNAQNNEGQTPLHIACLRKQVDFAHLLLYNGADTMIMNEDKMNAFAISLLNLPELQEILYNYTYDKYSSNVSLKTLILAMKVQSPYLVDLLNLKILYSKKDLQYLASNFSEIDPQLLLLLVKKRQSVIFDMIRFRFLAVSDFLLYSAEKSMEVFYLLCQTPFIAAIAQEYTTYSSLFLLITHKIPEDTLSIIILCLLSYGKNLSIFDLSLVYELYGFGKLFQLLIQTEVTTHCHSNSTTSMPMIIYNVNWDVNDIFSNFQEPDLKDFNRLTKYFAHPVLAAYGRSYYGVKLPNLPSLLELSRNCARKYLCKKYTIKNCSQFFSILKLLPICEVYKTILSYEKPIYV